MSEEYLTREQLIRRDVNGKPLPLTVTAEYFDDGKSKIKILPVPRGKLNSLEGKDDRESMLLLMKEHLVEPQLKEEDYEAMSLADLMAIVWAIMGASTGFSQTQVRDKSLGAMSEFMEDVVKKK